MGARCDEAAAGVQYNETTRQRAQASAMALMRRDFARIIQMHRRPRACHVAAKRPAASRRGVDNDATRKSPSAFSAP
jgi:hypothetical protein